MRQVTREINDQEFADIVKQYMTDEEMYEIEGMDTADAIKHFIEVFGETRWVEIATA